LAELIDHFVDRGQLCLGEPGEVSRAPGYETFLDAPQENFSSELCVSGLDQAVTDRHQAPWRRAVSKALVLGAGDGAAVLSHMGELSEEQQLVELR